MSFAKSVVQKCHQSQLSKIFAQLKLTHVLTEFDAELGNSFNKCIEFTRKEVNFLLRK